VNSYINTNSPTPLYFQIKEMLKEKIEAKEYQEGERIPSENELSDILDVSKPTIRKAIEELANEGYVRKLRGKGTFVTGTKIDQGFIGNLEGYSEEMKRRNIILTSRVLEKEILEADHKLSAKLNLNTGEEIVKLKRLRFIQGEPFIITSSYIPYQKVANILSYDFNNTSLYNILENEYGYIIEKGVRSFEPRLVNREEAELLDMAEHEPVQYIESITYIDTGEPIEYIEAVVKGSRSRFTVELVRKRVI
jgi:GntR family transcriptional regulator